jgi:hypothetical protein
MYHKVVRLFDPVYRPPERLYRLCLLLDKKKTSWTAAQCALCISNSQLEGIAIVVLSRHLFYARTKVTRTKVSCIAKNGTFHAVTL